VQAVRKKIREKKIIFIRYLLESVSLLTAVQEQAPALQSQSYTISMEDVYKTYQHNPPHYFVPNTMYIVTGSLLYNKRLLTDNKRKSLVCDILFERANHCGWDIEAWAVLENHYHFIARAPENALTLEKLIRQIHSKSAVELNKLDNTSGRKVWYNYWDTCITLETSYYARLHYVHLNPVKHRLTENAEDYLFCSYRWFLENADDDFQDAVMNQPIDRVDIFDDFDD
jgi:putative transposase